ncbi:MAG: hypothetical protein ACLTSZ_16555 [Lachnospiraceae bacterium]
MYLANRWYHLTIRPEYRKDDPVDGLDVSILRDAFLHPVLGIGDAKTDPRIGFVRWYPGLSRTGAARARGLCCSVCHVSRPRYRNCLQWRIGGGSCRQNRRGLNRS